MDTRSFIAKYTQLLESSLATYVVLYGGSIDNYTIVSLAEWSTVANRGDWLDKVLQEEPSYEFMGWLPEVPWGVSALVKVRAISNA